MYFQRMTFSPGRLNRSILYLFAVLLITGGSQLNAQLRTGSGSRSLYAEPPVREVVNEISLDDRPGQESRDPVQLASCRSCNRASSAIAEHEVVSHGTDPITIVDPQVSGDWDSGVTMESSHYGSGGSDSGYTLTGCDEAGCDDGTYCDPCSGPSYFCGPGPIQSLLRRLSIRAEVPLFWRRGHSTPALVTTSPVGTASDVAGQLGRNTTDVLRGGVFGQDAQAGFRITLGTYLDQCKDYGVLFRYWNAGNRSDASSFNSDDISILARPFLNTSGTAAQDTQLIAFPGDSVGNISVVGRSELYGLDVSLRRMWYADRFTRIDWLYGYQHTLIGERLTIDSETNVIGNVPPIQGSMIAVSDRFRTENSFHGSTVGFLWNRRVACFQFENMFRLGLGNLRREVEISGQTTTTSGGTSNTVSEGLLARGTNSRTLIDDAFVIAPEVGINLAWALNPFLDFTIGYNYQMVPKVFQAGDLIDPQLRVNLSDPLTGALDPGFTTPETRYWVRSLGLGLQLRY